MIAVLSNGLTLAPNIRDAASMVQKAIGFLGRRTIPATEGLLFQGENSLHMIGMICAIDVLFLDGSFPEYTIIRAERNVVPFRVLWERRATAILELGKNALAPFGDLQGQRLRFQTTNYLI